MFLIVWKFISEICISSNFLEEYGNNEDVTNTQSQFSCMKEEK